MKIGKKIRIDFTRIKTENQLYDELSNLPGFPDFFGRNICALIDCLFNLRYPQAEMTKIHLTTSEYLLMELNDFSTASNEIQELLMLAIENVSLKCREKNQNPSIILLLT